MKTFIKTACQGEIRITRVTDIPANAKKITVNGQFIVGHSETGHHHVLDRLPEQAFEGCASDGMKVLYALINEPTVLEHLRAFDTHETIGLQPGMYRFSSAREFDHYAEMSRVQMD